MTEIALDAYILPIKRNYITRKRINLELEDKFKEATKRH